MDLALTKTSNKRFFIEVDLKRMPEVSEFPAAAEMYLHTIESEFKSNVPPPDPESKKGKQNQDNGLFHRQTHAGRRKNETTIALANFTKGEISAKHR